MSVCNSAQAVQHRRCRRRDRHRAQRHPDAENELDHATVGAELPPRTSGPHLDLEPARSVQTLQEFERFYNSHRPHQGIVNARPLLPLPTPITDPAQITRLDVRRHARLGGILNETSTPHELHGRSFRQA
jgi:hypothetical protein